MNSIQDLNDDLLFAEETAASPTHQHQRESWKLMIVDDEEEIHRVTRLALNDFSFEDRGLSFISAFSGEEAKALLQEHPDTAVVLLDVVMESEHAGLDVARYIRETLNNKLVRIILRTGRPGQAPEKRVIMDYDINDYKEKSELTVQKLTTSVITALRSHRDLHIIDRNRRGLLQIINASAQLFENRQERVEDRRERRDERVDERREKQDARIEKREDRREDRQDNRAERTENRDERQALRQENREERKELREENREQRQALRAENKDDRKEKRAERRADRAEKRIDRIEKRTDRRQQRIADRAGVNIRTPR